MNSIFNETDVRNVSDNFSSPQKLNNEYEYTVLIIYVGGTIGMDLVDGVYSPVPNVLSKKLRFSTSLNDHEFCKTFFSANTNLEILALPKLANGKRILYSIIEYHPLLDSSNMSMDDWVRIANDIFKYYKTYDGFVVLHGTDTMAYTASALSFIIENLGKPVIITGSQIPLIEVRSDGRDNFLGALIFATYQIPEVCIYFNDRLYRGNRARKIDNSSFSAFNTPNMPPLAKMGVEIKVDWDSIFPATSQTIHVQNELCRDVALLQLFPGISFETVRAFLQTPIKGMVLESYGAGNAPSNRPDLIELFKDATSRGIIIVNCTQCPVGSVSCSYATGKVLMESGVITGFDMTPEAALTKLSYVLGITDLDLDAKKKMMSSNIRGELTVIKPKKAIMRDFEFLNSIANSLQLSSSPEIKILQNTLFPLLMCSAALSNDVATMDMLFEKGGNVNMRDYDKRTPLHVASSQGNVEMVKYLLNKGASVYVKDNFNSTPLYNAIYFKRFDVIRILVAAGAHLVMQPNEIADHLCQAAMRNDVETLKAWHMAGVSFDLKNYNNQDVFTIAEKFACKAVLEYLKTLKNGVLQSNQISGMEMVDEPTTSSILLDGKMNQNTHVPDGHVDSSRNEEVPSSPDTLYFSS